MMDNKKITKSSVMTKLLNNASSKSWQNHNLPNYM